jgi:hypothetical protein
VVECGPCSVFASFTLAFALQLRKQHGKASVRVRKTSVRLRKTSVTVQYTYYQKHPHITKTSQTHTLQNLSHSTVYVLPKTPTHYKALTNTHITKPTHTHTTKQYKITTVHGQHNMKLTVDSYRALSFANAFVGIIRPFYLRYNTYIIREIYHMCINILKPIVYVMHHQFNIQQLYALPTFYLCYVFM